MCHSQTKGRGNREHKHRPKPARQSKTLLIGGIEERSSRQGRSLAGCKSPHRQLPVFGRLAYPMRGEATNRVLLGRKSPGCPAGVFRSGRDDLGGEQTWRPEHNEISATSKILPRTKSF